MADEFETDSGADIEKLYSGKYLGAVDVPKPIKTKIVDWDMEELRQQDGTFKKKVVLSCDGIDKQVVVNKMNYLSLKHGFGAAHPRDWVGHSLGIKTEMKQNGKLGITLVPIGTVVFTTTKTGTKPVPTSKTKPAPAPKTREDFPDDDVDDPGFEPDPHRDYGEAAE
jgi:hypothetical protein